MADDFSDFRKALIEMAERSVSVVIAQRGPAFGPQTGLPLDAFGAASQREFIADFATGYDGSETVMAFRLDMSLLDGPDVLTD